MIGLLYLAIVISVVGAVVLVGYARREAGEHGTNTREELAGICASAVETALQKDRRKERALELLDERGELGNAEIRKELGVASRTVVRYMNELESEGKVEQVGDTGHAVTYQLK